MSSLELCAGAGAGAIFSERARPKSRASHGERPPTHAATPGWEHSVLDHGGWCHREPERGETSALDSAANSCAVGA